MSNLTYNDKDFLMDGKPFKIISGAMHYFRIHPDLWEDRLLKLKACGFNTVETYTCWNLHERREGEFDFSGILDVERFISIAEKIGLYVIVRPGPYICAEWEFGGLPSWLLKYPNITLRCNDLLYLEKVTPYYRELLSRIRPHLSTNGGSVIMMQVENEYGSYGDDKEYLRRVAEIYRENGIDCLLFTSDGAVLWTLSGGTLPELLSVLNFGSNITNNAKILRSFKPDQPFMCGEFWCGWFDHWYEEHHTRTSDDVANMVQEFFDTNGSFNFYMFHGGTNFSFWNGANHSNVYQPTVTSYDYCAPLTESGDMTETYFAIKEVIEKNTGIKAPDIHVENLPKKAYGTLTLDKCAPLFENLENISSPIHSTPAKTMEEIGQDFGYILYSTELHGPFEPMELNFEHLHDRAHIFLNGKLVGIRERSRRQDSVVIELGYGESAKLDILVENMGRVNYGPKLFDKKGIVGGVRLGQRFHFGWDHYPLTMDDLSLLEWKSIENNPLPAFYRGTLKITDTPADTFVRLDGFEKGFVVVNGFNVGRFYNSAGPQKTLYVPAPLLKVGDNEIIVFETDKITSPTITFLDTPEI